MDKILEMLKSAIEDLHRAGLSRSALQNPDGSPLNNVYQKLTSAIVCLGIEKYDSTK
jgi:hypothetical protein